MEDKTKILSQLAQLMIDSVDSEFDEIQCALDYEHDAITGDWSVGSALSFSLEGKNKSIYLNDNQDLAPTLVFNLHGLMKAHTGGNWNKAILTLSKSGQLKTKFQYPDNNA